MKFNYKTVVYCLGLALLLTTESSAEDDYIISKQDDEALLSLSIVFLVVCGVFFLISVAAALAMIQKVKLPGGGSGYYLEEREERSQTREYQSMYAGGAKTNGIYDPPPSQYESLKLSDSSNDGVYQPLNSNNSNGHLDGKSDSKRTTPPGTEKGQKDSKDTEKHKTLSSFQNPAYESSMPFGLDKEVDIKPDSDDHDMDTAL